MAQKRKEIRYRYYSKSRLKQMPFHSHAVYEIYYFHQGTGIYLIGDKIFQLQPGDLILMDGMTLHCSNIDTQYEYFRTTLHFDPAYTRELLLHLHVKDVLEPFRKLGNLRIHLTGGERAEVEDILQKMERFYQHTDPVSENRFLLSFLDLLTLVYQLCERPLVENRSFKSEKERHVQRIIHYVEEHYHEDLHMEQLERSLHLSKTYLSKIFKDVTGITLFKYVFQRRISQAKMYFLLEKKSVTEVCYLVGFKHLPHFSRIFKEQVGCTPEQYRKINIP